MSSRLISPLEEPLPAGPSSGLHLCLSPLPPPSLSRPYSPFPPPCPLPSPSSLPLHLPLALPLLGIRGSESFARCATDACSGEVSGCGAEAVAAPADGGIGACDFVRGPVLNCVREPTNQQANRGPPADPNSSQQAAHSRRDGGSGALSADLSRRLERSTSTARVAMRRAPQRTTGAGLPDHAHPPLLPSPPQQRQCQQVEQRQRQQADGLERVECRRQPWPCEEQKYAQQPRRGRRKEMPGAPDRSGKPTNVVMGHGAGSSRGSLRFPQPFDGVGKGSSCRRKRSLGPKTSGRSFFPHSSSFSSPSTLSPPLLFTLMIQLLALSLDPVVFSSTLSPLRFFFPPPVPLPRAFSPSKFSLLNRGGGRPLIQSCAAHILISQVVMGTGHNHAIQLRRSLRLHPGSSSNADTSVVVAPGATTGPQGNITGAEGTGGAEGGEKEVFWELRRLRLVWQRNKEVFWEWKMGVGSTGMGASRAGGLPGLTAGVEGSTSSSYRWPYTICHQDAALPLSEQCNERLPDLIVNGSSPFMLQGQATDGVNFTDVFGSMEASTSFSQAFPIGPPLHQIRSQRYTAFRAAALSWPAATWSTSSFLWEVYRPNTVLSQGGALMELRGCDSKRCAAEPFLRCRSRYEVERVTPKNGIIGVFSNADLVRRGVSFGYWSFFVPRNVCTGVCEEKHETFHKAAAAIKMLKVDVWAFGSPENCDQVKGMAVLALTRQTIYAYPYWVARQRPPVAAEASAVQWRTESLGLLSMRRPINRPETQVTEEIESYPVINSECMGQRVSGTTPPPTHYVTVVRVAAVEVAILAVDFVRGDGSSRACFIREAQASIMQRMLRRLVSSGMEVVLLGAFSDQDPELSATSSSAMFSIVKDLGDGNEMQNLVRLLPPREQAICVARGHYALVSPNLRTQFNVSVSVPILIPEKYQQPIVVRFSPPPPIATPPQPPSSERHFGFTPHFATQPSPPPFSPPPSPSGPSTGTIIAIVFAAMLVVALAVVSLCWFNPSLSSRCCGSASLFAYSYGLTGQRLHSSGSRKYTMFVAGAGPHTRLQQQHLQYQGNGEDEQEVRRQSPPASIGSSIPHTLPHHQPLPRQHHHHHRHHDRHHRHHRHHRYPPPVGPQAEAVVVLDSDTDDAASSVQHPASDDTAAAAAAAASSSSAAAAAAAAAAASATRFTQHQEQHKQQQQQQHQQQRAHHGHVHQEGLRGSPQRDKMGSPGGLSVPAAAVAAPLPSLAAATGSGEASTAGLLAAGVNGTQPNPTTVHDGGLRVRSGEREDGWDDIALRAT